MVKESRSPSEKPFPWHIGAFDAHCHCAERVLSVADFASMQTRTIAVMATRTQDQNIVGDLARAYGIKGRECLSQQKPAVVAGFGRHPWFSHELYDDTITDSVHQYTHGEDLEKAKKRHYASVLAPSPEDSAFWADLPAPMPLSTFIEQTRNLLRAYPLAMVGEIGLDSAFRLPMQWDPAIKAMRDPARTPGGREKRALSPHQIKMSHQQAVLKAQLNLAGEMDRAVSVHGVQAHGLLYDMLRSCWKGHELKSQSRRKRTHTKSLVLDEPAESESSGRAIGKPYPPRICLHSFSGKADAVRQYLNPKIPASIFFSFSKTNNMRTQTAQSKMEDAIYVIPENRLLVESDLHTAGQRMDAELEQVYRLICEIKHWELEEGVKKIAANFEEFVFG